MKEKWLPLDFEVVEAIPAYMRAPASDRPDVNITLLYIGYGG